MRIRASVTMDKGFLRAYSQLVIRTCHRRGIHAMGGWPRRFPSSLTRKPTPRPWPKSARTRPAKPKTATTDLVAHPGLVQIVKEIFDTHMRGPNQIGRLREDLHVTREALLELPKGPRTWADFDTTSAWGFSTLKPGCAAMAVCRCTISWKTPRRREISRAQVWQWLHYRVQLDGGEIVESTAPGVPLVEEESALSAVSSVMNGFLRDVSTTPVSSSEPSSTAPEIEYFYSPRLRDVAGLSTTPDREGLFTACKQTFSSACPSCPRGAQQALACVTKAQKEQ